MINVFTDMHHAGLLESLRLLFEKRLEGNLYRPIGMEWATEGYWHVYDHPDTQKQYLLDGYIPKDHTPPLNSVSRIENGIHIFKDEMHHTEHKAITLEQFKSMKFDIVIASIPSHILPFKKLVQLYQPQAHFVFQQGNMFHEVRFDEIPNLLSSTIEIPVPPSCNAVFYHQEFNTSLFGTPQRVPEKQITSFIHLLPQTGHSSKYYILKQGLYEYIFKSYGILCDDGIISGIENVASIMNLSMWGFHAKWAGDGFGHILYNWYASGKPVITCISDYKNKLGGELLTDGETCIDLDAHPISETIEFIRNISQTHYDYLCQKAKERFQLKVNYDTEEQKIREWIKKLH